MALARRSTGLSLLELMVALSIISIGMLGFVGAFSYLSESISNARYRTIAANLAQEKQEYLKKISYYRLVVTTSPVYAAEAGSGNYAYDASYYPSETLTVGGNTFIRRTYIQKVQANGNAFVPVAPTNSDTGMKEITVYVMWQPGGAGSYWVEQVNSFYSNPNLVALGATVTGTVTQSGGGNLQGVTVQCLQDTDFWGTTASNGSYTFQVAPGSYTLRASSAGFFTGYSPTFYVTSGSTATQNISLTRMGTGTADGVVWIATYPVISQVVASSGTGTSGPLHTEWIELYNPSTSTVQIASSGNPNYTLWYTQSGAPAKINLTYVHQTIRPNGYYLIANTSTVTGAGVSRTADAVYAGGSGCWGTPLTCLQGIAPGGVQLQDPNGNPVDSVAWGAAQQVGEGTFLTTTLLPGMQYVRMTSTGTYTAGAGPSYDTNNNSINFVLNNPITAPPHSSTDTAVPIAGLPGVGAVVTSDDGLSVPTTASQRLGGGTYPYAEFTLTSMATGTYTLAISSGFFYQEISSVTITANATDYVPNAVTSPTWVTANAPYSVFLASGSTNGYVTGYVKSALGVALSGLPVTAGSVSAATASDGSFILAVPPGLYTVTANGSSGAGYNSNYVSVDSAGVNVSQGDLTTDVDFFLTQGGSVTGWVTTNGTDPLPNVQISAFDGNNLDRGDTLSGSNGYFTIPNLSTGTYNIEPQLDIGESVSPSSPSVTVLLGQTIWSSTFTVSGAFGTISGSVFKSGSAITTGVLLMATTSTISGFPPTDNAAFRSGSVLYYATSSMSDGTYSLPVRGAASPGTNYNLYGWYTTWSNSTSSTTVKVGSATVTEGGFATFNFNWP